MEWNPKGLYAGVMNKWQSPQVCPVRTWMDVKSQWWWKHCIYLHTHSSLEWQDEHEWLKMNGEYDYPRKGLVFTHEFLNDRVWTVIELSV